MKILTTTGISSGAFLINIAKQEQGNTKLKTKNHSVHLHLWGDDIFSPFDRARECFLCERQLNFLENPSYGDSLKYEYFSRELGLYFKYSTLQLTYCFFGGIFIWKVCPVR